MAFITLLTAAAVLYYSVQAEIPTKARIEPQPQYLQGEGSQKCITCPGCQEGGQPNDWLPLSIYPCPQGPSSTNRNQEFEFNMPGVDEIASLSDLGSFTVTLPLNQHCLGIGQGDTVGLTSCAKPARSDQLWSWGKLLNGYRILRNKQTGKCLNVENGWTDDGRKIMMYDCAETASNNRFRLI